MTKKERFFHCPMCGTTMREKAFARGWPREYRAIMRKNKST